MNDFFASPPGATPFDADGLIGTDIQTKEDLDEAEAIGIMGARTKHLHVTRKQGWFSSEYVRRVHRDMFKGIWSWAGDYRDKDSKPNLGIPYPQIPIRVEELCQDISFWRNQKENPLPILEQAVRLHHKLVWIHPFRNGNGRHARLMSDVFLSAHKHPLPLWPHEELMNEGSPRSTYIAALKAADQGNFTSLIEYTQNYIS